MINTLSYKDFIEIVNSIYNKKYSKKYSKKLSFNFISVLNKAISNELTKQQKKCYTYYYKYNNKVKDIAQILGVSEPTVSIHLKRARNNLYNALKYYVVPEENNNIFSDNINILSH